MAEVPIEDIAKRVVQNREHAADTNLNMHVRHCYLDFVRAGEEILIHQAEMVIRERALFSR